jgi:hypothetical protein
MQSKKLLTESQIFKDEVLSGIEGTDNPSEEMSERSDKSEDHGMNLIETLSVQTSPSRSFCECTRF